VKDWRRFHRFDPWTQEAERRAKARAEETMKMRASRKAQAFAHTDPEVKRRREAHATQTARAKKRPVTLPKIW